MIKYIGFFDFSNARLKRKYITAATNKMEYIVEAINQAGYDVEIISLSQAEEKKISFYRGETVVKSPHFKVRFFPTVGGSNKLIKFLRLLEHYVLLLYTAFFLLSKDDTVIIYHGMSYYNILCWAKRIKKFKLILEVEEIYQDARDYSEYIKQSELNMFESADAYIFSTELLEQKLNHNHKPFVVIYGTYKVESQFVDKWDDGKIHVVYAGTFDPRKGGASTAVTAAMYLPSNYHLHVLGFGSENEVEDIKMKVNVVNEQAKAVVTYEGLLLGRDYIEFIQRCHIGLSTQNPDAIFNATSFPSKILSYMANGLAVVSVKIDAVTQASIGNDINYYIKQSPEEIANAIMQVDIQKDCRDVITELNSEFIRKVKLLLS